jgi:general secretion pathway protein B
MSYILDALTKAAQQRDRQVPIVQRLLSPAPTPRSLWTHPSRRLLAALALNAGLLAMLLVWWLRPVPISAPPEPAPAISAPAPRPSAAEPARSIRVEPPPTPEIQAEKPASRAREATVDAPAVITGPKAPAAAPPGLRPSAATREPAPAATPPVTAPRPGAPAERAGLRLEALIYSDLPAQRMVFINGRRYAEGDVIDGRLRVEEIQEDGVELSDQGQRFTLRAAR